MSSYFWLYLAISKIMSSPSIFIFSCMEVEECFNHFYTVTDPEVNATTGVVLMARKTKFEKNIFLD